MSPFILPIHLVIIPDGNRRWAKENNKLDSEGHRKGYQRANELVTEAKKLGIKYLTIWAFSTENWSRDKEEVGHLQDLIYLGLKEIHKKSHSEKAKFVHIGRKDRLSREIIKLIETIESETRECADFCLCMAIDYGGEDEILRAEERRRESSDASYSVLDFLDTTLLGIPAPDFIIRTSGEQRTSGFMPLQSIYSEWYFDPLNFPDFDAVAFHKTMEIYQRRQRRFGK